MRRPAVWVGCLACHATGMNGVWTWAVQAEGITAAQLHPGGAGDHEELWCFDVEDMPTNREMSPHEAARWGALHEHLHGAWPAFCAWVAAEGLEEPPEGLDAFWEAYGGTWPTWEDYVEWWLAEVDYFDHWPAAAQTYFDAEKFGRDLALDHLVERADDGGVHVFRRL